MDDLQRPPGDRDRDQLAARINRVHDEGRIGAADRDIRLGNVRSAQSMAELDLMTRELDQLEASVEPRVEPTAPGAQEARGGAPWSTFNPKAGGGVGGGSGPQRLAIVIAVVVAVVLVGGVALAFIGHRVVGSLSSDSPDVPGVPSPGEPVAPADTDPSEDPPAGPAYSLTAGGIRSFLDTYREKFGTSLVADLTLYGDYVIVNAPVPGKNRQSGWLYREGTWTSFGGVRATFPGTQVVDTNRLNIDALVRNINRARRTLNVEAPAQAYVIIRFIPRIEPIPSVDVHVVNQYQESGYLATTMDGKVQRAYPYDR